MIEPIAALIGEIASRAIDWVNTNNTERRRRRVVKKLVEGIRLRVVMIPTAVENLA
ncbi:hypothetical protein [Collinsella ihumii]|uniref:hypothetical protein n=1 Tax=Collinsella ihumii TaxID=1720204 RepID=UPI0025AB3417|nr:hypothetical protein [Collinsella ihumii]MDN0056184.1 hypothetical protein [Collinsella ihumii]